MIRTTALILLLSATATAALAQPKTDPDWPCVQRKVETLSPGQFWTEQGKANLMSLELARRNGDWPHLWNYRPEQM